MLPQGNALALSAFFSACSPASVGAASAVSVPIARGVPHPFAAPVAGQGLNMGLKDVAALAETVVDAARLGEDWGSPVVLERYQRWRRFDSATLAVATDLFVRVFSTDNPLLRLARGTGLEPAVQRGFTGRAPISPAPWWPSPARTARPRPAPVPAGTARP